jgi:hypothetical protein
MEEVTGSKPVAPTTVEPQVSKVAAPVAADRSEVISPDLSAIHQQRMPPVVPVIAAVSEVAWR